MDYTYNPGDEFNAPSWGFDAGNGRRGRLDFDPTVGPTTRAQAIEAMYFPNAYGDPSIGQALYDANPGAWSQFGDAASLYKESGVLNQRRLTNQDDDSLAPILNNLWMAPFAAAALTGFAGAAGASSLGGSAVSEAAASGFSMPAGAQGLSAFAPEAGASLMPAAITAPEVAGFVPQASTGLNGSLFAPAASSGPLMPAAITAPEVANFVPADSAGFNGQVMGPGESSSLWDKAKGFFTDPTTRTGMQAAQLGSKLIGSDGGDAQAKQQGSQAGFYASLASLISSALQSRGSSSGSGTPALDSTYNASQAVAPDQRSSFLYGSSGGPSTQAYTMEKGAPTAIPALGGSATGGTPTAPTMPSQGQGAIRMRRKMYA